MVYSLHSFSSGSRFGDCGTSYFSVMKITNPSLLNKLLDILIFYPPPIICLLRKNFNPVAPAHWYDVNGVKQYRKPLLAAQMPYQYQKVFSPLGSIPKVGSSKIITLFIRHLYQAQLLHAT